MMILDTLYFLIIIVGSIFAICALNLNIKASKLIASSELNTLKKV